MAFYFLELSLIDYGFLNFAPSHLAASAVCAAQKCLFKGNWVSGTEATEPLSCFFFLSFILSRLDENRIVVACMFR